MATDQDYATGTAAALGVEKQIIAEKKLPGIFVPSDDVLTGYAARVAKAVVDAVDAGRANG